ncbi:MAG: pentapeptide repeat-containing protein [Paracoccaceae bacterium]
MKTDDQLAQIEKIANNARTTWFGLLALLVFVGVTLMGHKDSDFFAYGAATQLPLVNIEVPPRTFFYAAPVLTTALYVYLHVYLAALWPALGALPLRVDGDPVEERIYPSILTRSGLFLRRQLRDEPRISAQGGGWGSVGIAFAMTWSFGQIILALLWWRSMPLHSEMLTLWIGLWFWATLAVGSWSALNMALALADRDGHSVETLIAELPRPARLALIPIGVWGVLLVSAIGWLRTEGGFEEFVDDPWIDSELTAHIIPLAQAQLAEAELSRKPADWLDFEDWKKEYTLKFRKRYDLPAKPEEWDQSYRDELAEEIPERWRAATQSLDKVSLRGADLRGANLDTAFLAGAILEQTRLDGVSLREADLSGARLYFARGCVVDFTAARLDGTILDYAELPLANLRGAHLSDSIFNDVVKISAALGEYRSSGDNEFQRWLDQSFGDPQTRLPARLSRPEWWDSDIETDFFFDNEYLDWVESTQYHYPDCLASNWITKEIWQP